MRLTLWSLFLFVCVFRHWFWSWWGSSVSHESARIPRRGRALSLPHCTAQWAQGHMRGASQGQWIDRQGGPVLCCQWSLELSCNLYIQYCHEAQSSNLRVTYSILCCLIYIFYEMFQFLFCLRSTLVCLHLWSVRHLFAFCGHQVSLSANKVLIIIPPITKFVRGEGGSWNHSLCPSVCPSSGFYQTTQLFVTKVGMLVCHVKKKCFAIFKVSATVKANKSYIKTWLFLLYLLNCWSIWIHTFFADVSLMTL